MKKIAFVFVFMLGGLMSFANPSFKADERVELAGVMSYLAGHEKSVPVSPEYKASIDEYFADFIDHESIAGLKEMQKENFIDYGAISNLIDFIEISNGGVSVASGIDPGKVVMADFRWTKSLFMDYVSMADKFYKDSDFHSFYKGNSEYYRECVDLMNENIKINAGWFDSFYGEDYGEPELYVAFVCKESGYPVSKNEAADGYGVIVRMPDINHGTIINEESVIWAAASNLNWSYAKPLYLEYRDRLAVAAKKLLDNEKLLSETDRLYPDPDMMTCYWLNDLFTMMYFRENNSLYCNSDAKTLKDKFIESHVNLFVVKGGVFWLLPSYEMMDGFYADRQKYATVRDYMPQIVSYYENVSKNADEEYARYESMFPRVENAEVKYKADGGIEISFSFTEPMAGKHGVSTNKDESVGHLRISPNGCGWANGKFVVNIDNYGLKKGKRYGFSLPASVFSSVKGLEMKEDYQFEFTYDPDAK